ncbi:MAG: hypothetical protein GC205_00860 [Bacteroidetes bacterium]|nr:hypothetical protein [Bacteroidota bacterium]
MKTTLLFSSLFVVVGTGLATAVQAQVCDPSTAPQNLTSTYTAGVGAQLQWDAVPGSIGVQIRIDLPSGSVLNRRIVGFERDQYNVPDGLLSPGTYTVRVQAACSSTPPYSVTPISAPSSFTKGTAGCPATVTDIDGNVYNTVSIGSQCWMKENLATETYNNGDPIPGNLDAATWTSTTSGAQAVHSGVAANKAIYGLLYNWYAVNDARGLCPTGWHVPTDGEWTTLTTGLGGTAVAGGSLKQTGTTAAGTGLWFAPNTGATNSSGFTGLPAGTRNFTGASYAPLSLNCDWWTSTKIGGSSPYYRQVYYNNTTVGRFLLLETYGLSVRCLKD